jgi:hypothetical protein
MSEAGHRIDRNHGAVVWTVLALLGTAAIAYVVARRVMRGEDLRDADSLLDAADRAANNLDTILLAEGKAVS